MNKKLTQEIEQLTMSDCRSHEKVTEYLDYLKDLENAGISTKSEYNLSNANTLDCSQSNHQHFISHAKVGS